MAILLQTPSAVPSAEKLTSIRDLKGEFRPLLVFAPSDFNGMFLQQAHLFAGGSYELHQRQVLFVPIVERQANKSTPELLSGSDRADLTPSGVISARKEFHISAGEFTVVLVGKDGGEKFRSHAPVTIEKLETLIDAMPMRQQEVRDGHAK